MTVRWKPLLILSGLFLAVALVGVVAITVTLVPRSSQGILKRARAARAGESLRGRRDLLQASSSARGQERGRPREFAGMYRDWSRSAPAAKKPRFAVNGWTISMSAVKFDKADKRATARAAR